MPEDILTPITKVLLKENDNLALIYPHGTSLEEFALYFFRVMRRYPLHRVYLAGDLGTISATSSASFNYLGTTGFGSGDDTLEVWEERPYRILHFAFGIDPPFLRFYKAQPAGVAQTAFGYKVPPSVGDKYDFIPGSLSPFHQPTVATETILHYKMSVYVGFYNPSDRAVKPAIRILGAGYDVIPIIDENFIKKMLAGIKPVRYVTVGGLRVFQYTVPDEWKDYVYIVNKDVIAKIMGETR